MESNTLQYVEILNRLRRGTLDGKVLWEHTGTYGKQFAAPLDGGHRALVAYRTKAKLFPETIYGKAYDTTSVAARTFDLMTRFASYSAPRPLGVLPELALVVYVPLAGRSLDTMVGSGTMTDGLVWDGTTMVELGAAPGLPWSAVTGRNRAGTMVGNIYDVPSPTATVFEIHAFVYASHAIIDLNSLAQSPLLLRTALGIDQAGRILCTDGQVGAVRAHALLLNPR